MVKKGALDAGEERRGRDIAILEGTKPLACHSQSPVYVKQKLKTASVSRPHPAFSSPLQLIPVFESHSVQLSFRTIEPVGVGRHCPHKNSIVRKEPKCQDYRPPGFAWSGRPGVAWRSCDGVLANCRFKLTNSQLIPANKLNLRKQVGPRSEGECGSMIFAGTTPASSQLRRLTTQLVARRHK